MDSVAALLAADAATLASTLQEHAALSGDAEEALARVTAVKVAERRDSIIILAAFALLAVTASYIVMRRVLYTLTGLVM